jgi:hypothetical protein
MDPSTHELTSEPHWPLGSQVNDWYCPQSPDGVEHVEPGGLHKAPSVQLTGGGGQGAGGGHWKRPPLHVHDSVPLTPGQTGMFEGQVRKPTQLAPSCTLAGGGQVSFGQFTAMGGHSTWPFVHAHVSGIVLPSLHGSIWKLHDPPQPHDSPF